RIIERIYRPDALPIGACICYCIADSITILDDIDMMGQVLFKLVKNGIEAVAETPNPRIELAGLYDETGVRIEVSDNGPGIIREALESIFVPFYTTKKTGSGIGLSLSRQIMQLHNGTLNVESEPGVRTVFTLRF